MADNVAVTAGSGTTIAADEVTDGTLGSCKVQFVKIMDGTLDGTTKAAVGANGLAVDGSGVTQPVSAASLPLPTGAATAAKQPALGTAGTASADVITVQGIASMTALVVDGSGVTQPVSAASLPLPTGASTAAKQPALGTAGSASTDVITVQGIASMTALKVDGSAVTQPVSGTLTAITNVVHVDDNSGSLTVDGTVTANPTSATPVLKNGLSNSASAVVSSTAAVLTSYYCYNPNASVAYIQIYDVATAGGVTVGTTTPKWSIGIPATSAANLSGIHLAFANGIQVAATTTATGSTAPSTALDCNFGYR